MKDRFGFDWSGVSGAPYWSKPQLGRRMFFRHVASSVAGYLLLRGGPLERVAKAAVSPKGTAKERGLHHDAGCAQPHGHVRFEAG